MARPSKYSLEVRERFVRLEQEHTTEHAAPSGRRLPRSSADRLGLHPPRRVAALGAPSRTRRRPAGRPDH